MRVDVDRNLLCEILSRTEKRFNVTKAIFKEIKNGADLERLYDQLLDEWSMTYDMWPQNLPDKWEEGRPCYTDERGWL